MVVVYSVSFEARDLIKKLLNKDQKKRLSLDQLPNHPFIIKHTTKKLKNNDNNNKINIIPFKNNNSRNSKTC